MNLFQINKHAKHVFYLQFKINVFQLYLLISVNEVIFYEVYIEKKNIHHYFRCMFFLCTFFVYWCLRCKVGAHSRVCTQFLKPWGIANFTEHQQVVAFKNIKINSLFSFLFVVLAVFTNHISVVSFYAYVYNE